MKQFGVGLAAAVLIDATIVRAVLLPASMKLLGDRNWYLPSGSSGCRRSRHETAPTTTPEPGRPPRRVPGRSSTRTALRRAPAGPPARRAEADDRAADVHGGIVDPEPEDVGEDASLRLRVVRPQLELRDAELRAVIEQLVDPLPRRVDLEPVAGARRDEGAAAAVLLDAELPLRRAPEHRLELAVVERNPEVVDPRHCPVPRLDHHVHGAALQLRQAELEPVAVEPLHETPGSAAT